MEVPMRYEYIEPFVASTIKVMGSVMQTDIAQGEVSLVMDDEISGDIAIVVRVKGDSEGHIVLNMYTDTAVSISNVMFGDDLEALTPIGMDSIAELANMIAGNATSALNDLGFDFKVYPPLIIRKDDLKTKAARIEAFQIPLFTEYGEIIMNVALRTN
jgi:chemotaxis protein CheX